MPFRVTGGQVHEVDFSQLDLFSITGPMGSGKSALIDAMVWCLYGRTARYTKDPKGVISAGEQMCEVALDFSVGERQFRAVRRTGKITESGLSEREGEEWIQEISGGRRLTTRIEELLGLDFDSFTKTVILPQGRYAEFLTSEAQKRRELLARILELGVYARVADRAKLDAGEAKTRAETHRQTLVQYAGLSQEDIALRAEELSKLSQRIEQVAQQEKLLQGVAQHVDQIENVCSRVTELQTEVRSRTQEKELAQKKADEATTQVANLTNELTKIGQEREVLGYDAARHEVVKRVVVHLKEWAVARKEAEQKKTERATVQGEAEALAQQIAAHTQQVEQARLQYQDRTATFKQLIAEAGDVAALTEKLGAAKRWKKLQQEQRHLAARIETLRQDHTATQHRLDDLKRQDVSHEQTVRELKDKLERAKEEERQNRELRAEAEFLSRELQEAVKAEKRVQSECENARTALTQAENTAQQVRQELAQAEEREHAARTALEDNQRRHEAVHLQTTLHIGDPCPVCQTTVSEIPTAQEEGDDLKELQAQMERAKLTTQHKHKEAQEAYAAVSAQQARLGSAEPELKERGRARQEIQDRFGSRFPGYASPSEAFEAVETQQKELAASRKERESRVVSAEQEKARLSRQRETTQQEEVKLAEALRGTTERLEADTRELDALELEIVAFFTTDGDPEQSVAQRRTTVMQAEQQMKEAEKALRRLESTLNSLKTTQVQKSGDLKLFVAEYEGALLQAEREARAVRTCLSLAEDAVLPQTEDIESELNALSDKQARYADLSQREENAQTRRSQVERQAAESKADLQARTRVLEESQEKQRQAQNRLEKERENFGQRWPNITLPTPARTESRSNPDLKRSGETSGFAKETVGV